MLEKPLGITHNFCFQVPLLRILLLCWCITELMALPTNTGLVELLLLLD